MKPWLPAIIVIAAMALGGCAGSMESMSDYWHAGPWWRSAQADDIGARARELEARGKIGMAFDHWRLVENIALDPTTAGREVVRLQGKISDAVQSHYLQGLSELENNSLPAARNHFLAALRLNPGFQPALKQIRGRFSPFPLRVYQIAAGDRPASVAATIFGDENKAFLVNWFNDLEEDQVLEPGSLLILPKLKKTSPQKNRPQKAPGRLAQARAHLSENDFEAALSLAQQADTSDPAVQALIHTVRVQLATNQIEAGLLEDSSRSLAMVPDDFAGKAAVGTVLTAAMKKRQFDLDLSNARQAFDQGQYAQALGEADLLLEAAPENVTVRELAGEARYRLALEHFDHKRYLETRKVLKDLAQNHEAGTALKSTVDARLAELAQLHYRSGVKHFINENLQAAIAEWETALACNPEHTKARENIENARRLLQKIEKIP